MMIARIAAVALLLTLADPASAETGGMIPPAGRAFAPLPIDQAVQKGMLAIRDLVRINHSLVTHRRMPPDHAARFARQVKAEADGILAASKIAGEDAVSFSLYLPGKTRCMIGHPRRKQNRRRFEGEAAGSAG